MDLNQTTDPDTRLPLRDFVKIAIQLSFVTILIHQFEIKDSSFWNLFWIVLFGFAVHAFLPVKLRLPFFVILSFGGFFLTLGYGAFWLIGIGLLLVGICHLPFRMRIRVAILVLVGALLALIRSGTIVTPIPVMALTLLASIFMFRTAIYLYDLKHERQPSTFRQGLSYFFLLPNACFAFFPVIDQKTFRRSYYNASANTIYQTGVDWIFKGITHLIFYRLLYHHFTIAPANVMHAGDLIQYVVISFLLYVQVSGQFHLIVGILHLFGFNLPKTHYLYFLVPNFAEVWRCLNIYWKDFMMKLFYYPAFFFLRKKGNRRALVLSTIYVFAATCLLHAYQWFWLIGNFPLKLQDVLFWSILGGLVLWTLLREGKEKPVYDLSSASGIFKVSCDITRTFLTLCILWSLWNSQSIAEWLTTLSAVRNQWWYVLAFIPAILLIFMTIVWLMTLLRIPLSVNAAEQLLTEKREEENAVWRLLRRPAFATGVGAILLIGAGLPDVHAVIGPQTAALVQSLREERLNLQDTELFTKGYYERLIGVERMNMPLVEMYVQKPAEEEEPLEELNAVDKEQVHRRVQALSQFFENYKSVTLTDEDCKKGAPFESNFHKAFPRSRIITVIARQTDDFLLREAIPYAKFCAAHTAVNLNSEGMRDKEYSRKPPDRTYRIAMLGSSHVFGAEVAESQIFAAVLEQMLNEDLQNPPYSQYEILNFSLIARDPFQHLIVLERSVMPYQPAAVFLIGMGNDIDKSLDHLMKAHRLGIEPPYDYIREIYRKAGITQKTPYRDARRLLLPYEKDITGWVYHQIASKCKEEGVLPVWIFLPRVKEREPYKATLRSKAEQAGFTIVDLSGVYSNKKHESLTVGKVDTHPNAEGHLLIAKKLFAELQKHNQLKHLFH